MRVEREADQEERVEGRVPREREGRVGRVTVGRSRVGKEGREGVEGSEGSLSRKLVCGR